MTWNHDFPEVITCIQGQLIPHQEKSLSTAKCQPMNERRKTEGKKDTTLLLIVKMSVTLPQEHTENLSAWDFPGRRRSHPGVKVSHVFQERSLPQALPYGMLTRRLTLNQSQVIEFLFPSLSNKQTNKYLICQLWEPKAWILGPPRDRGRGVWGLHRKQENEQGTVAVKRPLDRLSFFLFFFFFNQFILFNFILFLNFTSLY